MHTKHKGNIGSSAVIHCLHKLNINVFIELGDLSKTDLIAELADGRLIKIQVKFCKAKKGTAKLKIRKAGPNGYRYSYTDKDVDIFALYCETNSKVYWIPSKIACQNTSEFNVRITHAENNQFSAINHGEDFEDFNQAISHLTITAESNKSLEIPIADR